MNPDEKTRHFLLRAGFGLSPADTHSTPSIDKLMAKAEASKPIRIVEKADLEAMKPKGEERKVFFQKAKKQVLELNGRWVSQLADPSIRVREKMTLFWHDHFACRIRAPYLAQQQNNILRENSLGSFRELLTQVSKDPGMLQFLNNQQNKKNSPNENFAREVLELFTMGRGNYTEQDIKNAARAFTGWAFNPMTAKFVFREKVHDEGPKVFKGKKGNLAGEDILKIVLDDKQTARFITEKLCNYFVFTGKLDDDFIQELSSSFYASGYNIHSLMKKIFSSDWFYDARFRGNRIKSPIELVAGMLAQTGGTFENPQASLFIQRALSQILFYPPNVGGWPTGTSWIDSSSLTFRMSLSNLLFKNGETNVEAKDDGDINNVTNTSGSRKLSLNADWSKLASDFMKSNFVETLDGIQFYLLARSPTAANRKIVEKFVDTSGNDPEFIKKAFVAFMSLPEYQLS
ncbi:MAG: DUF1800 domain-containing protein [Chryseolinea sp.]